MGDHTYLKVKPKKITLRCGNCAKLSPRYCRPFEVLARIGPITYQLDFPGSIKVHDVFHVSLLKRYVHDASHIIHWNVVQVEPEGEFLPEPLQILEREEIELRNRTVARVKVQWKHFTAEEATWEREAEMMEKYPFLFK